MSIFDDVLAAFAAPTANLLTAFSPTATPTNNPATDATTAGAAIRSALQAGYTVAFFTSNNSAWTVPAGTLSMIGCVINGGGKGGTGTTSAGGIGGSNGGYLSSDLDMTGITPGTSTLNIQVGAAASSAGTAPAQADGSQSFIKFGATTLLAGAANANGIATAQGLIGTTSQPGTGGTGGFNAGSGVAANGSAGGNTGVATGGAGGIGVGGSSPGGVGSAGGAGTSTSVPLCGGAGGGGGGNSQQGTGFSAAVGGNGGNGGFPGGGSGGGGSAVSAGTKTQGIGGTPGNGIVAILYK